MDENDIQKLLKLKRYEQPSPEYFDKFLHDFHRRQRCELLRRSSFQIAWERLTAFFSEQSASRYAYLSAAAMVLLVAASISFNIVAGVRSEKPLVIEDHFPPKPDFNLTSRVHLPGFDELSLRSTNAAVASSRPRYVMDARPVSYEPASSF